MKCIVMGCKNYNHEVGDLCAPCHSWIARGEGRHSQAYRNAAHTEKLIRDDERARVIQEIKSKLLPESHQ